MKSTLTAEGAVALALMAIRSRAAEPAVERDLGIWLAHPVSNAVLAYFRIAFGAMVAWEAWRYLDPGHDWVGRYFTDKEFYFGYWPFEWVKPFPEPWIFVFFWVLMGVGVAFALGWRYRITSVALFLGMTYFFLLEKANYLNHLYLVCLLAFVMMFLPAHRRWSLDARRDPELRRETSPRWTVWLLRFQLGVPYFFGGIGKLNADWFRGEPLRSWLAQETDFPIIGGLFTNETVVWMMNYGALFLDLLIVPLLIWRKTRLYAYMAAIGFHLMNERLFSIGIFPWTMILATAVFLDSNWPAQLLADAQSSAKDAQRRMTGFLLGVAAGLVVGALLPTTISPFKTLWGGVGLGIVGYHLAMARSPLSEPSPAIRKTRKEKHKAPRPTVSGVVAVGLAVWVGLQVLVPLRHLAIPGNVHWTEEGHRWAWHMKLRDKAASAGFTVVVPETGQRFSLDPELFLTNRQERKMVSRPDMVVQFAHFLESRFQDQGYDDVEVYATVWASLNGRDGQRLIDPNQDLTAVSYPWWPPADWILPLED